MDFEEIEKVAVNTYNSNIEYLKKNNFKLYERLQLFEAGLNNELIKPKYDLTYENGYFDALNLETNEFFYGEDSGKYGEEIVEKQMNFSPKNSSFKAFYEIKFTDDVIKTANKANMYSDSIISNAPIIHYVNENLPENELMNTIPKLIILGVGLGTHIPFLHLKVKPKIYLIIEPSLELFRLSLFIIDYSKLSEFSMITFSVAENEIEFNKTFDSFYGKGFIYNHYFKHFMFSKNCDTYVQLIQKKLVTQNHLTYNYGMQFESLKRTVEYIKEDYTLLNILPNKFKNFGNKPVILLGAGPSLEKNIKFVKDNKNKFIIVSVYVLLPYLEKEGIKPDIVTQYDQKGDIVYNYIKRVNDLSFFDNTIFLFSSHLDKRVVESFPKDNIFMYQALFDVKRGFDAQTAPSIGEISYALLLRLGAKLIYLLGIDMALDPETNETHISAHGKDGLSNNFKKEKNNKFTFREDLIEIKGNLNEKVQTHASFLQSINVLNFISNIFQKNNDTRVFNLSNGAYFEKTTPLNVEDVVLKNDINKDTWNKNSLNQLLEISATGFTVEDDEIILNKLNDANILKEKTNNFFKIKDSNLVIYEDRLGKYINDICFGKYDCIELKGILFNYIMHNAHYIYHLINIKSLDNPKKHLKNINKILGKQILKIINTYLNIYEKEK